MQAVKVGEHLTLIFTTVLNKIELGLVGDDEEVKEITDRAYWEKKGSKTTLEMMDEIIEMVKSFDALFEPRYNKFYIGFYRQDKPSNFVIFRPKKEALRMEIRIPQSQQMQDELDASGIDVMDYDSKWGRYRLRLIKTDVKKHEEFLRKLIKYAYDEVDKS